MSRFQDVGANISRILVDGVRSSLDAVSFGIWQVIDGTATWADLFRNVARQMISQMLQMILTQTLIRGAMLATAAVAEAVGARSIAASIRSFTASAAAGAAKESESSGVWGLIAYLAILAATVGIIAGTASGFETGGVVDGGEQLIRVNEKGTEAVLNARATSMLGEEFINQLNAGQFAVRDLPGEMASSVLPLPVSNTASQPRAEARTKPQPQNILLVDSRNPQAARDFMISSEGKALIAEIMRDQRLEAGI